MKSQEGDGSLRRAVTANRSHRMPSAPSKGNTPFAVERAEGVYLITPDGRRILDAAGGAIVVNIGHGRSEVAEVAARSLMELTYAVPPFTTKARERLAERLTDRWLPSGLAPVGFVSGGSESVEYAIRLARQHHVAAGRPKRWKIIGSDLSYHGATLAGLSVGGHATRRKGLEPLFLDFLEGSVLIASTPLFLLPVGVVPPSGRLTGSAVIGAISGEAAIVFAQFLAVVPTTPVDVRVGSGQSMRLTSPLLLG